MLCEKGSRRKAFRDYSLWPWILRASPLRGRRVGDGNERTGDENSSRRERSETADGRSNPDHRKGSASRGEDILQGRGGHNGARIHLALERVLMIRVA